MAKFSKDSRGPSVKGGSSAIVDALGPIGVSQRAARQQGPSQRQLRVGESLCQALSTLLVRGELRHPLLRPQGLTIWRVGMAADLKSAVVFLLIGPGLDAKAVLKAFAESAAELRWHLAKMVDLSTVPQLTFRQDKILEQEARIEELLRDPRVRQDLEKD